jgi:hypothetical protein
MHFYKMAFISRNAKRRQRSLYLLTKNYWTLAFLVREELKIGPEGGEKQVGR